MVNFVIHHLPFTIYHLPLVKMQESRNHFFRSLRIPALFLVLMWGVHLFQALLGFDFGQFGLYPREVFGLRGVLFSPLIHDDFPHLISNTAPMFLLAATTLFFYPRIALRSMTMIYVLTGVAVWVFGRKVFHIGASGVVYGLVSFLFWMGIFRRSLKSIILAVIVVFLYSSLFLGILPNQEGISWESHLLGGLVGIFVAYWYKEEMEADEVQQPPVVEDDRSEPGFFFDRDVFERTKEERNRERWL